MMPFEKEGLGHGYILGTTSYRHVSMNKIPIQGTADRENRIDATGYKRYVGIVTEVIFSAC